jgi:hypothetical protein
MASYAFDKLTLSANRRRWGCEIGTPQYPAPSFTVAMLTMRENLGTLRLLPR